MRAFFKPLLIFGLALIVVVGVSWFAFPAWRTQPGGLVLLIVAGAVGLIAFAKELLAALKTWKELDEAGKKKAASPPRRAPQKPRQEQQVTKSEAVKQRMKRSGGDQKQTVDKSSDVEQVME